MSSIDTSITCNENLLAAYSYDYDTSATQAAPSTLSLAETTKAASESTTKTASAPEDETTKANDNTTSSI